MKKISPKTKILNLLFVLFVIALFYRFLNQLFANYEYGTYEMSEFLINYQGGFVRRGLLGEILFFFAKNFNIDVQTTIKIICVITYFLVCGFFVRHFIKKRYTLYLLPLCFFCGALVVEHVFWIRKDNLMLCFFIAILLIWQKGDTLPKYIKIIIINLLSIFILLTHEVFGFFTLPILFMLFFHAFKEKGVWRSASLSLISILPAVSVFFIVLLMKGNADIAQKVWNSWQLLSNPDEMVPLPYNSAIGALSWDTIHTFKSHSSRNFFGVDHGIVSIVYWLFLFPTVYYISTNTLMAFRKKQKDYTELHRTVLSSIILFQWVSLSPLFIVLSMDYLRLFFYLTTTSFALFLIVPIENLQKLFPEFVYRTARKINYKMNKLIPPTKYILVLLMLFVGISSWAFSIERTYTSTMLYHVLSILSKPFIYLKGILNIP